MNEKILNLINIQKRYKECLNLNKINQKNLLKEKIKRGYIFENIIFDLFEIYSLQPEKNITHVGEQLDITIKLNSNIYLIETKWKQKIQTKDIRDFFGKLWKRKCKGIFISHNDLSNEVIKEASEFIKEKIIILFDKTRLLKNQS